MWIPNFLTTLRIITAFIFPFCPPSWWPPLVVGASLTEFFDGYLARKFHWHTKLGQFLDPVADKLFAISVGLTLVFSNKMKFWQLVFVSSRDLVVAGGFIAYLLFYRKEKRIEDMVPNIFGKLATTLQYAVFLDILFLNGFYFNVVLVLAGIASAVSAFFYFLEHAPV